MVPTHGRPFSISIFSSLPYLRRSRVLYRRLPLTLANPLLFIVLPSSIVSIYLVLSALSENQSPSNLRGLLAASPFCGLIRSRRRQNKKIESESSEDSIGITTPSDSLQDNTAFKTDLTDLEDVPNARKHKDPTLELDISRGVRRLYNNPLDEGGVDLSEIPRDFDKALGTILAKCGVGRLSKNGVRSRKRYARHLTIIYTGFYASVYFLSKAKTKNLRIYYQKLINIIIDDKDSLEIRKGMKWLVKEFNLDTQPRKKTLVYIKDIGPFNKTILATTPEKRYIKSIKDPRGGLSIPIIELTPKGTKKFLSLTKLYGEPNSYLPPLISNNFGTRNHLQAISSDMPAHVTFRHLISRASIPKSRADFEDIATEAFHQQKL
ncbi:uncharacterized protein N7503_009376 [Penicillium pulvis]|uniref:uncharacterized protein n=1 Tax=Penicillium pulvis TaxID=1562058 RepID=UPI0025489366|nr:uncharacterized protein N7503_009376 [Penicillium pulvis]KAJ5793398.1 hypothetical protein N7503_009376 [Penicillium pulvis]